MISLSYLMAAGNVVIAAGLLLQGMFSLNRITDPWVKFAIHLVFAMTAGVVAFRGWDIVSDLAFADRVTIGRLLLNVGMLCLWIMIRRYSKRGG
ncbi:hypothetical protein [Kushneria phosphatilytica]|uniref:Uncharacterized protein n=1 Tax=Kushneria phosphatilytica TaxID=657387 RepID=A0A1S1NZ02_9GAMM|nr:hypothetical protein [Kushneria phosphatilytica]OHV12993.1 hypothetical protein BH688_03040 [Kushneria phosphatilytica]QEL10864.1 hypothetical protein FY550_06810 [Kushneria phosphatilytica]